MTFLKNSPLKEEPAWYLHDYFPGWFVYSGIVISIFYFLFWLIRIRKGFPLPFLLSSVCILMLCLVVRDKQVHSLFEYLQSFPGFSTMRLPGRIMGIAVFVMLWATLWYLDRIPARITWFVFPFISIFMISDNLFELKPGTLRTLTSERRFRTDKMEELIKQSNRSNNRVIAVVNVSGYDESFQLDVMLATQRMNLYTFNGYSSNCYLELCFAYNDPKHAKLNDWMKRFYIDERKVTFIHY